MNTERTDAGLSTLSYDSVLGKIARAHSADMQTREYFNHADPEGCSSSCRADAAGYTWRAIGENIYFSSGYKLTADASAAMTVDGWMHSSGHRANILGEKFTHVGVGVAVSDEDVYITAVFAKPR